MGAGEMQIMGCFVGVDLVMESRVIDGEVIRLAQVE